MDGVRVIEYTLPYPPTGVQFGLFAWGNAPVLFERTAVQAAAPKAFVVTQYGEPFDSLFSEVILPVAREMGREAYRASDVFRPGVVLQDIIQGLVEAEVVIAEVTPVNANVFYELGYAHALVKATILLSTRNRDHELAFDIRGFRVVFYDDTIRGKRASRMIFDVTSPAFLRGVKQILRGPSALSDELSENQRAMIARNSSLTV